MSRKLDGLKDLERQARPTRCAVLDTVQRWWDGGIDLRLGDRMNGFLAEEKVHSMAEVIPWFQEAIAHFYPDSTYAKSLDPEVKARAAHRLFQPPITGARVTCPHCGAPNANPGRMEEILCFVCARCGAMVEVAPPKVQ